MAHFSKIFVATDAVIFRYHQRLELLLIQRGAEPFLGTWALPGGHLEENEQPEAGCLRELIEETGIRDVHLKPLMFYGDVKRDPRYRLISLSFIGFTEQIEGVAAASDAKHLKWFTPADVPELAFDHKDILRDAYIRLRAELEKSPIAKYLLGREFTISRMQKLYEEVFEKKFDKRNFRRKLKELGILEPSD